MTPHNGASTTVAINDRIDNLAANLKHVVEHMSARASAFKDDASQAREHASATARTFFARASKVIQDHPIAAIGVAFGLGYLATRLWRR